MGWFHCTKHKKVSMEEDWISKHQIGIHLVCGCNLTQDEAEKYEAKRVISWELKNGTKIKKTGTPTQWIIQEK